MWTFQPLSSIYLEKNDNKITWYILLVLIYNEGKKILYSIMALPESEPMKHAI